MRSRRRFSPSDSRHARRALAGSAETGARRLVGGPPRVRRGLRRAGLGRRRRLGFALVPRLLPLRRPADGAAPRARLARSSTGGAGSSARRSSTSVWRSASRSPCPCTAPSAATSPRRRTTSTSSRPGSWQSLRTSQARWPSSLLHLSRSGVAHSATRSSWQGSPLPPLAPRYPAWVQRKRRFLWQLQHFFFTEVLQPPAPDGPNQSLPSRSYRVDIDPRGLPRACSGDCGAVRPR